MANSTDSAEGAQPLEAQDTASWSLSPAPDAGATLSSSGDAPLPPGKNDGPRTMTGGDRNSGAEGALQQSANGKTVDELIAALPAQVVEAMTAKDIDALVSGDPQAVAGIFMPEGLADEGADTNTLEGSSARREFGPPGMAALPGPERISLRGLSAQDRIALADLVRGVKEGRFASLDEARAALQPSQVADPVGEGAGMPLPLSLPGAESDGQAQAVPETTTAMAPEAEQVMQHMAHLQALQQEAADVYDTAAVLQLNEQMAQAQQALAQAEAVRDVEQQQLQNWTRAELHHAANARQQFAAELADPVFSQAVRDERDLAVFRQDPVLARADWPVQLAERVRQRMRPSSANGSRAGARARGMVASPSMRGAMALSTDDALDQIGGLSELEVDAVLSQIRERERASRGERK